jgi:hypothetical protein
MQRHGWLLVALLGTACSDSSGDSGTGDAANESGESGQEDSTEDTETTGENGPPCDGTTCASGEYCDWANNRCESGGPEPSMCRPIPQDCETPDNPDFTVCGCDGNVYESICEANAAGTDIGEDTCTPPNGMFACGWKLCTLETEVCQYQPNSEGYAHWWSCDPTPPECIDDYSCACIQPVYDQLSACSYTNCSDDLGVRVLCGQASG